jgi:hypothetical protein
MSAPKIVDSLRHREDEHHRDDGHWSESLEGERHILAICSLFAPSSYLSGANRLIIGLTARRPSASFILDKVRLNLFHSYPHINIFPQNPVNHFGDRYVCFYLLVFQINRLAGIVPLRDHVQFQLG